jgi:Prophage CP4-57 regulatory protein (AlpA)
MNRHERRVQKSLSRKGQLWRYPDLVGQGIVNNRMTLRRWTAKNGFPAAIQLGPNTVAWDQDEVLAWLASRRRTRQPEVA